MEGSWFSFKSVSKLSSSIGGFRRGAIWVTGHLRKMIEKIIPFLVVETLSCRVFSNLI